MQINCFLYVCKIVQVWINNIKEISKKSDESYFIIQKPSHRQDTYKSSKIEVIKYDLIDYHQTSLAEMGDFFSLPFSLAFGPYLISKLQFLNEEFYLESSRQRNLACYLNSIITSIPLLSSAAY